MFNDRKNLGHSYDDIISVENLLAAWKEFLRGKRKKPDVQEFQHNLMDNVLSLHRDLVACTYTHGNYHAFKISDPKPRDIHKATVRDRLLHHAIYRILYSELDRMWITDSYSCRNEKGTHRAMRRFRQFAVRVSKNRTRTCWVLKCDIRKFFASIDHKILLNILSKRISDIRTVTLIQTVVTSFESSPGKGLPLGNLTSQLLVNLYMNEFDQFCKHTLRQKYYIRYADDFVFLSHDRIALENILPRVVEFLSVLSLQLHPDKVYIKTISSGVDFLGWIHFLDHVVLRTSTKRRMLRNLKQDISQERIESYKGLLRHGNTHNLMRNIVCK